VVIWVLSRSPNFVIVGIVGLARTLEEPSPVRWRWDVAPRLDG